jgi:hypothetical protein
MVALLLVAQNIAIVVMVLCYKLEQIVYEDRFQKNVTMGTVIILMVVRIHVKLL